METNAIKKMFLDFAASLAQSKIVDIATTGTAAVLTSISPYIAIPLLVLEYVICSYGKDKIATDERKKELDCLLQQIRDSYKTRIDQLRDTQISELEEIINCYLVSKATHKGLEELKVLVEESINYDQKTLGTILNEIVFSKDEIETILEHSKAILFCVHQIENDIKGLSLTINEIKQDVKEIKNNQKKEVTSNRVFLQEPEVPLSVFCSCTTFPPVKTEFSASHGEKSLDSAINLILHWIEQGNYVEALNKTEEIFSKTNYQGSHELIAWKYALVACIYFLQYDPKGNDAAHKSEDAFNKTSLKNIPPFLAVTFAKYHINVGEIDVANKILMRSVDEEYSPEAKALLLSLSENTIEEDVNSLTLSEQDSIIINSVLAKRSIACKDYDNAIVFARKAYYSAKSKNIVPPADIYAEALFKHKFPSDIITVGFMRHHIEDKEWPEVFTIIDLYQEYIFHLSEIVPSKVKSFFLYRIALVSFICGKETEATHYAQAFFDLDEVEEDAIELCAIIILKTLDEKRCLRNLEKFEQSLPDKARFLYGSLLVESGSNVAKGIQLLEQIIEEAHQVNSLFAFCSSICMGRYWLQNKEEEKYTILLDKLRDKGEYLSYYALSAEKYIKDNPEKSRDFMLNLIPLIPLYLPARVRIVEALSPLFQLHKLFSELLQLMDSYVPMDEITEIGKKYYSLALKAKDSQRIKNFGKSLRHAGIWDRVFLLSEFNYTLQYSKLEAEDLANDCLNNATDVATKKIITVFRDIAALSTGNFEKYSHEESDYPSLTEIPANASCYPYVSIPLLLKEMGIFDHAIKYAYGLYILFPKESSVRKLLISLVIRQDKEECLDNPNTINENAAFKYRSLIDGSVQLVIVEPHVIPNSVFKTPTDPLVSMLWNTEKGFRFKINSLALNDEYEITEITNKYIATALQVMKDEALTPESGISLIKTPSDALGNIDVSAVFEATQQMNYIQQQKTNIASTLYQQRIRSLYIFKRFAGVDTLRAVRFFSSHPNFSIESAVGDIQERNTALAHINESNVLLLSPLTLDLLIILQAESDIDVLKIIIECGIEVWISEYLFADKFSNDYGRTSFTKLYNDGQNISITDDRFEKQCYEIIHKTKRLIHEKAKIIKGKLLDSDFEQEEQNMEKGIWGKALYHTMLIANENENVVLWDDDAPIVALFNQSYQWKINKRLFSQAIFLFLKEHNKLTPAEYFKLTVFLMTINERFTSFDSQIAFEVFFRTDRYGYLRDRIDWYFENSTLERTSFAKIIYDSMILFFTQYTNLQRAKDGLLELYKMAVKQDSALMEEVLCKAVLDSLSKDKRKAKPVIKHVINSLKGFISIEAQGYVSALVKDYKNQL